MAKLDLASQIESIQYSDEDNPEFEEIIKTECKQILDITQINNIPMELLVEYNDEHFMSVTGKAQPFNVYSNEDLNALAKSIAEQGVINPITVRPIENGMFQILAGRNRTRASKMVGKTEMPCIIRDGIDDVTAALIMLDTNLEQRHQLTYSEKAYAYKMRLELKRSQGKRTDLQEGAQKVDTLSEIGLQNKQSRRTVAYLIRLTYLIPELLQMVDTGRLNFKIGVGISYLSEFMQRYLYDEIIPLGIKIKNSHISELKDLDECGCENTEEIKQIFFKNEKVAFSNVTISGARLQEYTDIFKDSKEIEERFFEFLNEYRNKVQRVH